MPEHLPHGNSDVSEVLLSNVAVQEATNFVIKRAKELVSGLVKQKGSEEPPFLAEKLALLHGIKRIERIDLGDLDALLLRLPEGYVIKINSNRSQVRQNYSCAHEIAHTFLHELERQSTGDDTEFRTLKLNINSKHKERLCEVAAAELLMPELVFRKYLSRLGVSISSIEPLARAFRVSILTTAIRITEVSEEPCIALKWKPWQKARSKGFYLDWHDHILESRYVRNPSPLLEAYEGDIPVKCSKFFEIGNVRKRCYMESKGFGRDNMRYVISLVFPER